jgi:aminoglycoside/choline kinase family phosphotransferase
VNPVAGCAEDLNVEWLSEVLGFEIRSLSVERIGAGQTSSAYRLTIDADDCPPTLIAKIAEGDEVARRRVATAHRNEVGFYTRLAKTLEVRTPACWHGAVSDDGTEFTLLLEDLAPRLPGRQVVGCSIEQMSDAAQVLATLHACRWNDETLRDVDFLIPLTKERAEFLGRLGSTATEQFISRFASRLDRRDISTLCEVAEVLVAWQLSRSTPFSLVHGDYRLDNLMFPPVGTDVIAVDWQTATVGLPARDLSYFIATSLSIEQRRAAEHAVVRSYYDQLRRGGVKEEYSFERCFEDYRFGQLQGPMITVIGCMTSSGSSLAGDDMFLAMASRSCAAIRDLDSLKLP